MNHDALKNQDWLTRLTWNASTLAPRLVVQNILTTKVLEERKRKKKKFKKSQKEKEK